MKRIISLFTISLLTLVLVACGSSGATGRDVRVNVPNMTIRSVSLEMRITITDTDKKLTDESVVLKLSGPDGFEQTVEGLTTASNKKIDFTDLTASTEYRFTVNGEVDGKNKLLYSANYKTADIGTYDENPILINTVEDFLAMSGTNAEGKHRLYYKQTADLDFEGASIQSLFSSGRSFSGGYDGNGFVIKNINISERNDVNRAYPSIFGYVSSAKIKNVTLDNVHYDNTEAENGIYTGSLYASLLVSKISTNNAVIENITIKNSSMKVEHNSSGSANNRNTYIGLVLASGQGTISNIKIEDSNLEVNTFGSNRSVTATEGTFIGGAIGLVELERATEIKNLFVDLDITVNATQHRANIAKGNIYLGGVIGAHRGYVDIDGVAYTGNLDFKYEAHEESEHLDTFMIGGLIGQVKSGSLYNAYVNGAIVTEFLSEVGNAHIATSIGLSDYSGNKIVAANSLTVLGLDDTKLNVSLYNFSRPKNWSPNSFLRTENAIITINEALKDLSLIETILVSELENYFDNEDLVEFLI